MAILRQVLGAKLLRTKLLSYACIKCQVVGLPGCLSCDVLDTSKAESQPEKFLNSLNQLYTE